MSKFRFRLRHLLVLSALCFALLAFAGSEKAPAEQVKALYARHLERLDEDLTAFQAAVVASGDASGWPARFAACRTEYKYLEFAIEYQFPYMAQRLNGAALPEVEASDPNEVVFPTGFQVLEERVYAADAVEQRALVQKDLQQLLVLVRLLRERQADLPLTEETLYDALRLNFYRLAAKGLTGFDSPVAQRSVGEAAVTVRAAADVLETLGPVAPALRAALGRSQALLEAGAADFGGFDRARFFTRGFYPLLRALHAQQRARRVPFVPGRRAVRPDAVSFFAAGAFDPAFFAPPDAAGATPPVLALGKALFSEAALSPSGRSCVSCHLPSKAYADGRRVNASLQHEDSLSRNTPTLLHAALQPVLFYDGRARFLEDQIHDVISNQAEMNGQLDQAARVLRQQPRYRRAFAQAFPREAQPVSEASIGKALAAYVRALAPLNSRFDQYLRGDTARLTAPEVRGFNLFAGKAKCGSCHYLPLLSGAVPPLYDRADGEVLGVPAPDFAQNPTLDPDPGMYAVQRLAHRRHAFKTPTVRNVALTAPYMHNGAFRTLEEVVDFYDRGGGIGLGLAVPNQTLPADPLALTPAEKQALVAFLKALTDE